MSMRALSFDTELKPKPFEPQLLFFCAIGTMISVFIKFLYEVHLKRKQMYRRSYELR